MRSSSFRANLSRASCAGGILRLWALYEHVLRRLLPPHSREGESARGFEASSALTGCFLLRAVFVEAAKNEEGWRTRDEVRYSNIPPGGAIESATVSWKVSTGTWEALAMSWKVRRGLAVSTVSRYDGVIDDFGGVIEVATELGDIGGVVEGATVS